MKDFISSPRKPLKSLWKKFFRDPSQFSDMRNTKSHSSPDFIHKRTGKGLWIDGVYNPAWVQDKLQKVKLPCPKPVNNDRSAIIELIKSCAKKKDICKITEILANNTCISQEKSIATTLIRFYAKCGALDQAKEIFDQLMKRDVVLWTALISGYADQGFGEEALKCYRGMIRDGVAPDSVTYACILKACSIVGSLDVVQEIHAEVRDKGILKNDILLGTSLVNAYAKCGAIMEAEQVFDKLAKRDVVLWTALIAGYTDQGFGEEALRCFRQMKNDGLVPDSMTFASCLKACSITRDLEITEEIHAQVREKGILKNNIVLGTALVTAYAKCGALNEARQVFEELAERNVVSWSALIDAYVYHGFGEEALTFFREMKKDGVAANLITYASALKGCAIVGALGIVEEIHAELRKQGLLKHNIVLGTALVNAYAKCGALKEACQVFDQLANQDIESWNALLDGYAGAGRVNVTQELLNRMVAGGIFPNVVTFLVLLNGCSHGALLEEGQRLFEIIGLYGLAPTSEHYACMVDLFGRAGQFDRAQCYVLDDMLTLLTFLGACRKWRNSDLGRWAFDKTLQLDQNCPSAYVRMAHVYLAAGMTNEIDLLF